MSFVAVTNLLVFLFPFVPQCEMIPKVYISWNYFLGQWQLIDVCATEGKQTFLLFMAFSRQFNSRQTLITNELPGCLTFV